MRRSSIALLLVALAGACLHPNPAPVAGPPGRRISIEDVLLARAIADSAEASYLAADYPPAARRWERAGSVRGYPDAGDAWYNAACAWALAGRRDRATAALARAIDAGWHDAEHTKVDTDLASLHGSETWDRLMARMESVAQGRRGHSEVDDVRLITTDIGHFWRAYDLAAGRTSFDAQRAAFVREYLDRATPGLVDYFLAKIGDPDRLARFVMGHRDYYDAVRPQTLRVDETAAEIREGMRRLKGVYPDATFPDVYFVIGILTSGGTASRNGLLIGTEMYSATAETPRGGLSPGIARIVGGREVIPNTVLHEMVHFVQQGGGSTLLADAIREGTAVYLAQLVEPLTTPPHFMRWGRAHEAEVRARFLAEQDTSDLGQWIGNNSTATEDWPADLGYFIGYRIAEQYVAHSPDRDRAIRDLLVNPDPKAILDRSGYASMPLGG